MDNVYNINTTLIFLNEFYYLNKFPYQTYIQNLITQINKLDKNKVQQYKLYLQEIQNARVYTNILSLFGIYNPYLTTSFNQTRDRVEINNQEHQYVIEYNPPTNTYQISLTYYHPKKCITIQWMKLLFTQFQNSQVISAHFPNQARAIQITIQANRIKTNTPTHWQQLFVRILFPSIDPQDNVDIWLDDHHTCRNSDKQYIEFAPPNKKYRLFPYDSLISSEWHITTSLIDQLIPTQRGLTLVKTKGIDQLKQIFQNYLNQMDWKRKKDYLLIFHHLNPQSSKHNIPLTRFYQLFFRLDPLLQTVILNYL